MGVVGLTSFEVNKLTSWLCLYRFSYLLDEYLQMRGLAAIPALSDGRFPDELKVKHCIAVWKMALVLACRQHRHL